MAKCIILDTNFLLIPAKFSVDVFAEIRRICDFSYELCAMEGSIRELERLRDQGGKTGMDARAARATLVLLKSKHLNIIPNAGEHVDDAIVAKSGPGIIVATQDAALRARAKAKGARVIVLRQKAHLIFA